MTVMCADETCWLPSWDNGILREKSKHSRVHFAFLSIFLFKISFGAICCTIINNKCSLNFLHYWTSEYKLVYLPDDSVSHSLDRQSIHFDRFSPEPECNITYKDSSLFCFTLPSWVILFFKALIQEPEMNQQDAPGVTALVSFPGWQTYQVRLGQSSRYLQEMRIIYGSLIKHQGKSRNPGSFAFWNVSWSLRFFRMLDFSVRM